MKKQVIFIAFTPYHLFNAIMYALTLKNKTSIKTTLIWQEYAEYNANLELFDVAFDRVLKLPSVIRGKQSRSKRFGRRLLTGSGLLSFTKIGRYIKKNNSNSIVMCFSDQDPTTYRILKMMKKGNNNYVYLVEEGSAIYNTTNLSDYKKADYRYYLMKLYSFLGVKNGPYIGYSDLYDAWIVKHPELLPENKKGKHEVICQVPFFEKTELFNPLTELNTQIKKSLDCLSNQKYYLWISGPLTDCGIEPQKEIELLERISSIIPSTGKIIIKLHPRENRGKYEKLISKNEKIELLELGDLSWIPIEYIMHLIKPICVITVMSSAARSLFDNGLKCWFVYCYKMFNLRNVDISTLDLDSSFDLAIHIFDSKEIETLEYRDKIIEDENIASEEEVNSDVNMVVDKILQ